MAGIGDYIHYFPINYYYHGIRRSQFGQKRDADPIDIFSEQRNDIKKKVNSLQFSKKTDKIQNWLNFFISELANGENGNTEVEYAYQQGLNTFLYDLENGKYSYLVDKINKGSLDIAAEDSDVVKEFDESIKNLVNSSRDEFKAEHGSYLNKIQEKVKIILLARDFILKKSENNYEEVNAKIDEMIRLLNEIFNDREIAEKRGTIGTYNTKMGDADKYLQENENNIQIFKNFVSKRELDSKISNISKDGNYLTFKQLINELLKDKNLFPLKYFNKEKGTFAEIITLSGLLLAKKRGLEEINRAIEDSIAKPLSTALSSNNILAGSEKTYSKPIISFNKFTTKNVKLSNLHLEEYQTDGSSIIMKASGTEDKVDFSIKLTPGSNALNVSMKNYNLFSKEDISLVTGTSLYYLLQDEKAKFVNHYFNVLACNVNTRFNRKINGKNTVIETGIQGLINEWRQQSYIAAALTIIYKAFTGDVYGRAGSKANIFIVYNNKAKPLESYYVYNIKDIMNKIFSDAENLNSYISISANNYSLSNLILDNEFVDSKNTSATLLKKYRNGANFNYNAAYIRIGNILAEAVKVKIHAGLKKKTILDGKI